ncbi:MAG TPA: periplasmic heavy metal sensor [Bacteroidales bacterium]|nr:periplasmic heavy metal sensor [Bacteroidales bacterium]
MNTENKRSWMIWAIVVLAVMNLSILGTILYHQYQTNKETVSTDQAQGQLETDAEKFSGRYFRDKLNLNGDQMEQFRAINPVFRQQARAITMELASIRKQMLAEMAANNSDTTKLNALSDAIGQLHSHLKKLTYRYYLDMKGICNTEQQKQLEQLFTDMFTNDASMSFPGKGGRGWQHGKHMNNN